MKSDSAHVTTPALSFEGKHFCLTGKFDGVERTDLERQVELRGGIFAANVDEETDYLVVGSKGTRCCSFACCSRVVAKAFELKKNGARLLFVQERDFLEVLRV